MFVVVIVAANLFVGTNLIILNLIRKWTTRDFRLAFVVQSHL